MQLEPLENAMIAELALSKGNSVANALRVLQQATPALKRALLIALNKFSELQREFREGEKTRKEANNEIRGAIMDGIREAMANIGSKDARVTERNNDLDPEVRFERHELDRFKVSRDTLTDDLNRHGTAMGYAPIFPMCKPFLLPERLDAAGIPNSKFEGHAILDSQLVVGITNEEFTKKLAAYNNLKEGLNHLVGLGKAAFKVQNNLDLYTEAVQALRAATLGVLAQMTKVPELTVLEQQILATKLNTLKQSSYQTTVGLVHKVCTVLKEMLDYLPSVVNADTIYDGMVKTVGAATGKKLVMVGKPGLALGASWLWLMTEKELNVLGKCAVSGHCSITKWGLAFQD